MSGLREAILAAEDLKHEELVVPEWGGTFQVRELSGAARGDLEQQISDRAKKGDLRKTYRVLVVIASLYDADGNRVFSYDDVDALNAKSGKALERVAAAADRLNKLSDQEVENLAKN